MVRDIAQWRVKRNTRYIEGPGGANPQRMSGTWYRKRAEKGRRTDE